MATTIEPLAPWLRDLNRLFTNPEGGVASFVPAADVIALKPHKIQVQAESEAHELEGATS